MTKVIVVYESKYGNTKLVAEKIMEGMEQVGGIETVLIEVKEVDLNSVVNYDAILIGSPNHIAGPTRGIKEFIDKLGKLNLGERMFAVFDTYLGKDFEKAVKKMEGRVKEKAPRLSIKVEGMKGPIAEGELPKCKDYGNKIAIQIKT